MASRSHEHSRDHAAPSTNPEALSTAILRSAADPIVALDAQGRILTWNHSAARQFGVGRDLATGCHLSAFLMTGASRDIEAALERIFTGEQVVRFETGVATGPQEATALSINLAPVYDEAGIVIAASAIMHRHDRLLPEQQDSNELPLFAHLLTGQAAKGSIRRNILVAEDEALIGLGLTAMLEVAGFDVIGPAGTVEAGMSLLDRHDCALAILDINLGQGETSEPLAQRLTREGIPFIVTSGNLASSGATDFGQARRFAKPVGARTLVAAVHEVLG